MPLNSSSAASLSPGTTSMEAAASSLPSSPAPSTLEANVQRFRSVPLLSRVREMQEVIGYGAISGGIFGAVNAVFAGYDGSPPKQRLRGILRHARHDVPSHVLRIAAVTGFARATFWGIEAVRGDHVWERDLLIAAPIVGAAFSAHLGPKAAAISALVFGGIASAFVGVDYTVRTLEEKKAQENQDKFAQRYKNDLRDHDHEANGSGEPVAERTD